jgi:nitrite reductase/ring-hydroxylating ferredoxin subunit
MAWLATGIATAALPSGALREVNLNGHSVLLINLGQRVHAVEGICPHQGGILADGSLESNQLVCPEHGAHFDVETGRVLVDPHGIEPPQGGCEDLRTYPTRIVDGLIQVELG